MKTYWQGRETPARRVRATIGPASKEWWSAGREGETIDAVAIDWPAGPILLDDTDGKAWHLVTEQLGSSIYGFRKLPVTSAIVAERD